MEVTSSVNINLKGLERFKQQVEAQLNGAEGPIRKALKLWAVRYRSWCQQRFDLYSKGGGDWQKLALSTIKRRRQGTKSNITKLKQLLAAKPQKDSQSVSGGGQYSILRDTGLLFGALSPVFNNAPGSLEETIPFGVRVGYGGPERHNVACETKSMATIADIAKFHQNGAIPKLPQRIIIADAPDYLKATMAEDMTKALAELAS